MIIFSIPAFQTYVAKRFAENLNESKNVNISIGRIGVSYGGELLLEDVLVLDHYNDTLIFSQKVNTSLSSFRTLINNSPSLGNTTALDLQFNMKIYEGEERDNLKIFLDKLKSQNQQESAPFILDIEQLEVVDGKFSYIDQNLQNSDVVVVDDLNLLASGFLLEDDEVFVDIEKFSGFEKRGLDIRALEVDLAYTAEELRLNNLQIKTPESSIEGDVVFDIRDGFADFANKVPVNARFETSTIATNDLQPFYDAFGNDEKLTFSTTLEGTLNNFILEGLEIEGMDRTVLEGDLVVENIFGNEEQPFSIDGNVARLATNYYDLINLLPGLLQEKLPRELTEFGNVILQGDVFVSGNTLATDATLFSQLGSAEVDVEITDFNNPDLANYKGDLQVQNFDVGRLLDQEQLGNATFDIIFDGRGFTAETLNTSVRGTVSKFEYNDYPYRNFKLRGTLRAPLFNGNLISNDPNLQMEFNGLADFSKKTNVYDFEASVAHADLAALNFIKRDSTAIFRGDIITNLRGTNLNNAAGRILLMNTSYKNDNDYYVFDDLELTSSFEGPVRTIEVNSPDVINGTVEGIFDISEVPALVENAIGSLYTNYRPNKITTDQYLNFDFDIYNKIVELFFPEITLAPNTHIRGSVESDESEFRLNFRSPGIEAFSNRLKNVNIQVDNSNPLFNTYIEIDSVSTGFYDLSDFNFINVTLNDTLFIRSEFRGGPKNDDIFNLNLYHTINQDNNSVVGLQRSDITFKESVWHLNAARDRSNRVIFSNGFRDILVDSLVLSHQDEEIRLAGMLRDSTYKDLKVEFENVDLFKVTPEIEKFALDGVVDGTFNLRQQDGAFYPNSSLVIQDLEVNDEVLGNLNLEVEGNENLTAYKVNTSLRNEGLESLSAEGTITVAEDNPKIDLDVALKNFNLAALGPLGGEVLTNIRGLASGDAVVSGNYTNPDMTGKLVLNDAGLSIPYLEVDYDFEDGAVINLTQQQFVFDDVDVIDTKFGTTGVLEGSISHQNFKDWILGLNIDTDRLLVLDTEYSEEALYYGTAFLGGSASIYGPTSELVIDVLGETEEGTVFKIPINDYEAIGDNSFIHFLSPEEKAARLAGEEIAVQDVKGLALNFDLDVTDDALVEIEMDESVLRGRGAGTLLFEINTLGKFNMWGDFIVNNGEYIFNYGALQKRFEVQPGGSINWSGNPALADLNISAVYEAQANPAVILDNSAISRRIPVDVVINLQGELLQPDISFDLEYPNVTSAVRSELEYKIETGTNTEMQAFSLLALGQFYTPDVLAGNAGNAILGGVVQSASSGIFSSLLADDSGIFEVGLNYEQGLRTPDQTTADRFGVTLSTQINDRVLINGQVGVPVGGVTETVIVGNLEIEFLLNEEGNLRANIFNRENNIQYIGEELGFTQGVGLSYQVDFDTFRELLHKILDDQTLSTELKEEVLEEPVKSLAPGYIRFPGADGL